MEQGKVLGDKERTLIINTNITILERQAAITETFHYIINFKCQYSQNRLHLKIFRQRPLCL
jgi:hypothetical protein